MKMVDGRIEIPASERALVERIYGTIELSSEEWVGAIREASERAFHGQFGSAQAFEVKLEPDGSHQTLALAAAEPHRTAFLAMHRISPRPLIKALYSAGPVVAMESVLSDDGPPAILSWLDFTGASSLIGVLGLDETGYGLGVSWIRKPRTRLTRPLQASLRRIAAHIRSASQIRRGNRERIGQGIVGESLESPAMSLTEHALARHRERLREQRRDPREVWEALLRGQWSLAESFDSAGRRHIVARLNGTFESEKRALSVVERAVVSIAARGESHKAIAIDLDKKLSTTVDILRRAMEKMGIADRHQLIDIYSAIFAGSESRAN